MSKLDAGVGLSSYVHWSAERKWILANGDVVALENVAKLILCP